MADRESPEPTERAPEAREGDRAPASDTRPAPAADPKAGAAPPPEQDAPAPRRVPGAAQALFERIDTLQADLRRQASALTALGDVVERLSAEFESQGTKLTQVAREVSEATGRIVRAALDSVQERSQGALDGLRTAVAGLEERLASTVSGGSDALQMRFGSALETLTTQLRTLEERVEDGLEHAARSDDLAPVRALPGQLAEAMAAVRDALAEVGGAQTALEQRVEAFRDATSGRTDELESVLADALTSIVRALREDQGRLAEAMGFRFDEAVGRNAAETTARVQETATKMDTAIRALAGRVAQAMTPLRDAVDEALRGVREQVAAVRSDVDEFRKDAGDLRGAMQRVEGLAESLDAIGRRRGLKELAEVDRQVLDQQAALVEEFGSARERVGERLGALEEQLKAAAEAGDVGQLQAQVSERLASAVDKLRGSVAEEVAGRVSATLEDVIESMRAQVAQVVPEIVAEAVRSEAAGAAPDRSTAREMRELSKTQRELDKAIASLRSDVGDVKRRITAWGRQRGSPKMAEEISSIEGRVGEVERLVQEDLVDEVYERMQRAFDRRFDALVQLLESRLRPPSDATLAVESRRGLFRRPRES
jgi:predicted  nucleic acid-binding Zn-ribbon protein